MDSRVNDYILELTNLKKVYGNVVAVENVTLKVRKGEFLTLLGPSGSGKTTVLLMIAGFEYPTSGEIRLQDITIGHVPPDKRGVGMVFQNYALFPHMNIFDNIAFPLKMRKVEKKEIERKVLETLDLVQLNGYESRYPKQLSGGQQQRIAFARAIVFNPPLLLMDEPLGALDKKLREHMQLEIKHIQSRLKRTVIYVTHDQEESLVMSDRIAVMNEGRIEQVGTPNELYESPADKFVAEFIGQSNFLEGTVVEKNDDLIQIQLNDKSRHKLLWNEAVEVGEDVCFCIRPEKMFILREKDRTDFGLEGILKEVIYVGETTRYKVVIGKEKEINIREMNIYKGTRFREGEKVKVTWDIRNIRRL